MKRQGKKKKNLVSILIVIIIIMALVIVFLFLKLNKKEDNKQSKELLDDDCKCVEWNGTKKCPVGFELKNDTCKNEEEGLFTNVLISCSKYKCPEYYVDVKE